MKIKRRGLMVGWYPKSKSECETQIKAFLDSTPSLEFDVKDSIIGAVVPHAGWTYSGKLAAQTIASMQKKSSPDVIFLFGGHLSVKSAPILYDFDSYETPFDNIEVEKKIQEDIKLKLQQFGTIITVDDATDNTTEIQLPFIKYFFPDAKIIILRTPPSQTAIDVGKIIGEYVKNNNINAIFIGSTDLTHYGVNYMFAPRGKGEPAVEWVKTVNDFTFINYLKNYSSLDAIAHANASHSACSSGASASVMEASKINGAKHSKVVDYYTSYDIEPSASFVGYVGVVFNK